MLLKRSTAYWLFFLAYIGALVVEKPAYHGQSVLDCFSYLFTVLVHFSLFACVLWGNRRLLIPQLLENRHFGLYAGALLTLLFLYTFLTNHSNQFIHGVLLHDSPIGRSAGFWDTFVYALCCSVIVSMHYITEQWSLQQDQFKNVQINQLQTELKYLRSQLNPHFLFNGLNTVYGNIDMANERAREMMVQFSDLLRYHLYEADVDMIELEKELRYLENYVALQKERSNENMQVTLRLNYQNGRMKIAPLIFMAFVENAFKHASRDSDTGNRIFIELREEAGRVDFLCENSYEQTESVPGGIGLNNAVRRLDLLYKDRYHLAVKKEQGIYQVIFRLVL